jgi:glycosyltransferase involved in cell wall biosynthesis
MKGAALIAMPSRYEAWPLTAIEAAAVGTPVVGSNITGVKDAAPQFPQAHGELVPEGDIGAFASAMLRVLRNEGLRREMGERGRAWAARFSWDALAQEQIAFYYDIIHHS